MDSAACPKTAGKSREFFFFKVVSLIQSMLWVGEVELMADFCLVLSINEAAFVSEDISFLTKKKNLIAQGCSR